MCNSNAGGAIQSKVQHNDLDTFNKIEQCISPLFSPALLPPQLDHSHPLTGILTKIQPQPNKINL